MKKILAYVASKHKIVPAAFTDRIVDLLQDSACDEHEARVSFSLADNCLILSAANERESYVLSRAAHCPIVHMTDDDLARLPAETRSRGVDVAVATLLQSADKYVLLTRRSAHMRTFPGVWVPPGGHLDLNESLEEAGTRELREETGIFVQGTEDGVKVLGLWESAFPPSLSWGTLPSRHHILVYLNVKDCRKAREINDTIELQADEVDRCVWVCPHLASHIISSDTQFENFIKPFDSPCDDIDCSQNFASPAETRSIGAILIDYSTVANTVEVAPMLNKFSVERKASERVSTGTKFALKMWLQN